MSSLYEMLNSTTTRQDNLQVQLSVVPVVAAVDEVVWPRLHSVPSTAVVSVVESYHAVIPVTV